MFAPIHTKITAPNVIRNFQLPPNSAMRSERRSPKVSFFSNCFSMSLERISCCCTLSISSWSRAENSNATWISWVALSTAILAVLAAIAGLLSGQHVNEAMMNQIEASNQWNYYQAKSIKASVLDAKMSLAGAPNESDQSKRDRYEKEQEEIKSDAERKEAAAKSNFHKHEVFARGVTMFQIAIAIAAISALTKRRHFWLVSLLFGVVGCVFLVLAAIAR